MAYAGLTAWYDGAVAMTQHTSEREARKAASQVVAGKTTSSSAFGTPGLRRTPDEPVTGAPLDPSTRTAMEAQFGFDLSRVRIHHDAPAATAAAHRGARAFTVGRDIYFGAHEYAPGTPAGRRLLAHELTHTLQQANGQTQVQCQAVDDADPRRLAEYIDNQTERVEYTFGRGFVLFIGGERHVVIPESAVNFDLAEAEPFSNEIFPGPERAVAETPVGPLRKQQFGYYRLSGGDTILPTHYNRVSAPRVLPYIRRAWQEALLQGRDAALAQAGGLAVGKTLTTLYRAAGRAFTGAPRPESAPAEAGGPAGPPRRITDTRTARAVGSVLRGADVVRPGFGSSPAVRPPAISQPATPPAAAPLRVDRPAAAPAEAPVPAAATPAPAPALAATPAPATPATPAAAAPTAAAPRVRASLPDQVTRLAPGPQAPAPAEGYEGDLVFGQVRSEVGNDPAGTTTYPSTEAAARGIAAANLNVGVAVQSHADASAVRRGLGLSGAQHQSAHIAPTAAVRDVPGYSRGRAVTVLAPNAVHRDLDAPWKEAFQQLRQQGRTDVTAGEVHRSVSEAIQGSSFTAAQKSQLEYLLYHELFLELGLTAGTIVRLPYPNIPANP